MCDRLIWSVVLCIALAAAVPVVVAPLVTLAVVGTLCFCVVQAVRYFTDK